ncbi:ATP-binding protein [Streptomyces sp. NPDC006012]|uniref:ATP-binding protein n=1 Tax=Streptomyces sp. NPDC006012 TaxID=3364739 RepID=UPI0036C7A510
MSTYEVDAPARHAPPTRNGIRGFAVRWSFRRKLNLLVGVPLAVVAALLSYLINGLVEQSNTAHSAARLVRDSAQVARLVDRVEAEHQQAILLSVRYESGDSRPSAAAYLAAQKAVDGQVRKVLDAFGDRLPAGEAQALREVQGLSSLRDSVETAYLPADNIDPAYTNAAEGLIDGLGLDRSTSLSTTFTGNLLDSLLRADAAHAAFETSVFSATTGDTNALIEFTNAVGSYEQYQQQADRFGRFATEAQSAALAGMEHTSAQSAIAKSFAELQIDVGSLQSGSRQELRRAFHDALAGYPHYPDQAAARLKIVTSLIGQIAGRADDTSGTAQWRAVLLLGCAAIGFAVWFALSVLVRRSVIRPVQALTEAAQEVAEVAGRELARVADDDTEDDGPPRLRDMPVTARDEIGDLAGAFNHVQTTAAALLERQVLSRRNTAEMFGNVGRRVSNLTARQLALIDAVERGETDPAVLERLYSIDHIAVRLRRNADSLMLLAGIRETVLDSGPTPLTNVVRAALGQIEGYQRVRLYAASDAMVEPDIIGDLTLMVAELLENAVSFSPEGSPVEVTVRRGPEGAYVVVADHGLGMSAERLAEENARLVRRERLDLVPTKVLGLFVVGTLARRWEIGVELTRTPGGGVTAEVSLPSTLLLSMSPLSADAAAAGPDAAGGNTAAGGDTARPTAPGRAAPAARHAEPGGPGDRGTDAVPDAPAITGPRPATVATGSSLPPATGSQRPPVTGSSRPRAEGGTPSEPTPAHPGRDGAHVSPGSGEGRGPLPRRLPRRDVPQGADRAAGAGVENAAVTPGISATAQERAATPEQRPLIPRARTETPRPAPRPGDGSAPSRPLRRRVRGATLRATEGAGQAVPQAVRPRDAAAEREALEEFEAAVARARLDSDTGSPEHPGADAGHAARTHDQNHHPEGAEQ